MTPLVRSLLVVAGAIALDLTFWAGETTLASGAELPIWFPIVLTFAAHTTLIWRRSRPLAVLMVQLVLAMASVAVPLWQPIVGLLVAVFAVAVESPRRAARWAWLAAIPLTQHAVAPELEPESATFGVVQAMLLYLALGAATWLAGRALRRRRGQWRRWHAERSQAVAEAVQTHRVELARDLHDGVANTITSVLVQAAVARAARSDTALVGIEAAARRAMEEIQSTLALMPRGATVSSPGLDELPSLLDLGRAAGLHLTHAQVGTPRPLDPVASAAAYRTVQEAITNTLKYAPPGSRCQVTLTWLTDELVIDVVDRRSTRPRHFDLPVTGGRGLTGLTDRLSALGGAITAGAHGSGYRLEARLPVGAR